MKLKLPLNNPPGKSPQDPEALPLERVLCSVHTCKLDSTTLATATRTNQQRSWMHSSSNHSKKYGISGVATCKCAPAKNTRRQQHISKVASARPITKRLPNVFPYKPSTARIKLEIHGNYLSLLIRVWNWNSNKTNHAKPATKSALAAAPNPRITPKTGAPSAPRGSPARASEPGGRAQALTKSPGDLLLEPGGRMRGFASPSRGLLVAGEGGGRSPAGGESGRRVRVAAA